MYEVKTDEMLVIKPGGGALKYRDIPFLAQAISGRRQIRRVQGIKHFLKLVVAHKFRRRLT